MQATYQSESWLLYNDCCTYLHIRSLWCSSGSQLALYCMSSRKGMFLSKQIRIVCLPETSFSKSSRCSESGPCSQVTTLASWETLEVWPWCGLYSPNWCWGKNLLSCSTGFLTWCCGPDPMTMPTDTLFEFTYYKAFPETWVCLRSLHLSANLVTGKIWCKSVDHGASNYWGFRGRQWGILEKLLHHNSGC